MSASEFRESVIACDAEGCGFREYGAATLGLQDGHTAADVRTVLKRRGWTVGVKPEGRERLHKPQDFCPEHKP